MGMAGSTVWRWGLALLALLSLAAAALVPAFGETADHLDAPGLTPPGGDTRLDLTDVYAFRSPANSSNTVLVMGVNPLAGVLNDGTFHPGASYDFKIDTDGDAKEDLTYKVTFGAPDGAGVQDVTVRRVPAGSGAAVLGRGETGDAIALSGGGMLQAEVFDDPFFFDLLAFLGAGGRSFCDGDQEDFFDGFNVSAIVLEVPSSSLGPSNIGVWARTELNGTQVDRMGRPAINTVFILPGSKNAYNAGKPKHDARDFSGFLGAFAGALLPDILTVDTSSGAGFLNGRRLADDVIDIELKIITGNPAASDCVPANDAAFSGMFPYLALAH